MRTLASLWLTARDKEAFVAAFLTADSSVVLPQKSRHKKGIIEIVSGANIRESLGLAKGSALELEL